MEKIFNFDNTKDEQSFYILLDILREYANSEDYCFGSFQNDIACVEKHGMAWEIYFGNSDGNKYNRTKCNDIDEMAASLILKIASSYELAIIMITEYIEGISELSYNSEQVPQT